MMWYLCFKKKKKLYNIALNVFTVQNSMCSMRYYWDVGVFSGDYLVICSDEGYNCNDN